MLEFMRICCLLLYKNWTARIRHGFTTILELFFPIVIIGAVLLVRMNYDIEPSHVIDDTHYPVLTKEYLIENHIPRSIFHLYYKPRNGFTNELMADVLRCTKLPANQLFSFDTEEDMLQSYEIQQGEDELISILAIDFANTDGLTVPKKLEYTLRSSQKIPTKAIDPDSPEAPSDILIDRIPIVPIQMCLDDAFIDKTTSGDVKKPTVVIQKMPLPPYDTLNPSEEMFQFIICIFGGVIFLVTIYVIPSYVSAEKTNGVNTLLKLNGVKSWQNYLSWLVMGILFCPTIITSVTLILKYNIGDGKKPFYDYSHWSIIWLVLSFNLTHIYAFCLHITSYFSKAWPAQLAATTLPLLMNIIVTQLKDSCYFFLVPYLGFLCPTVLTMRIFDELNILENQRIGAHWKNIFEPGNRQLNCTGSLGYIMLFSIFGTIFHFIISQYLDVVIPNKFGVSKHPLFFLENLITYWKPNKVSYDYDLAPTQSLKEQPNILEPITEGTFAPGVRLRNLTKSFTCGFCSKLPVVKAVRNINMDFYKGQITALLGHNGAGKTTTFSILTGLMAPSAGTVHINNKDITKELNEIQEDLGLCTQENMMFPDFTVREQLGFVGSLKKKNETKEEVYRNVDKLLRKLGISDKQDVMPDKLSGGQKRRLCLGMALIGDASTIFLDEPTSGLDPETSRAIWDLIREYRDRTTIVMTTHSMEEADILGDRIAIMHSGKMKCYGSPMFLKKFYGHNFYEVTLSTTSLSEKEKIRNMVGSDARMHATHETRIVISIPFTSSLPEILDEMEKRKVELGITGISVSLITLEQVFMKAAEDEATNESADDVDDEPNKERVHDRLTGSELTKQKIYALIMKQLNYFVTNKDMVLTIIIGALCAVVIPELCFPNYHKTSNSRPLVLSLYQSANTLIHSENQTFRDIYKNVIRELGGTGGIIEVEDSLSNELLARANRDSGVFMPHMIISAELNSSLLVNGFYSEVAAFSSPITVNAISNTILKMLAGNDYSISARIADLPQPLRRDAGEKTIQSFQILTRAILFMAIFAHIIALFVKHPLLENRTKFKQLQRMTGVSPLLYWGTMFIVDYAFYIAVTISMVFVIYFRDWVAQTNHIRMTEIYFLMLLLLLFGINALLLAYVHSFIRKRFHVVYSILSSIPMLITFIIIISNKLLLFMGDTKFAVLIVPKIFTLVPHISFVFGYVKFSEIAYENARCRGLSDRLYKTACAIGDECCAMKCSDGNCENPLPYLNNMREGGGVEEFVIYLLLTPIILLGIIYWLERDSIVQKQSQSQMKKLKPNSQTEETDYEIKEEKEITRIAINKQGTTVVSGVKGNKDCDDENVFMVHELSKHYGDLEAVKEVSFRVKKNECFGLLGVNGAGKTTTFRMLVGEEIPRSGNLQRGSYNIKKDRAEYLAGIGYCPQSDALIPYFNAREHLSLFALLRGIPNSEVASEVKSWINKLQLNKYADNPSKCYSGGNKRRLNIAMALIASPEMIFLDEPTTGVDPAARRLVWTVLQKCQRSGQAIILTSHSMEECEVLCNRLVIMVQGRLLCVGSSQELKKRFGAGFNVTVKLHAQETSNYELDCMKIKNKIQEAFDCVLQDEYPGYLSYHIINSETTWVKMFSTMNALKSDYECVEDFTVSTSTLEQLFMQFARSAANTSTRSHVNSHGSQNV